MKKCFNCKLEKEKLDFSDSEFKKSNGYCKCCRKILNKEYKIKNRDKIREQRKNYYLCNKGKILSYHKKFVNNNRGRIYASNKKYDLARRKRDPEYKLRRQISSSVWYHLNKNGGSKKGSSCLKYFPWTIQELKNHLEQQFESWMTWNNWGVFNIKTWNDNDSSTWTWNIDHIMPQSKLPYSSMVDDNFKKCWALSNLRPYPSNLNVCEGDRRNIYV